MKKHKRQRGAVPLSIRERILRETAAAGHDRGTAERARHGTVAGDAQAYVVSRVDQLHQAGRIDDAGRTACCRYHRDWALGVQRVIEGVGPGGSDTPDAGELRHLMALQAYRRACEGVGARAAAILTALVCDERSWAWIADRLRAAEGQVCDESVAAAVACLCIRDLAAWYQTADRSRGARPK